jgi:hypothetical protein
MLDGVEFGNEVVALVRGFVDREIAPLKAANEALQARVVELEARKLPEIDMKSVEKLIEAELSKLPAPEPAKEIDMEAVAALVSEAVAAVPPARDGKPGKDAEAPTLKALWDEARSEAEQIIHDAVAEAVAKIPPAVDGKDAAGIVAALKDSGELVLTLQDGRLIRTGIRDGEKGADGRDGFGFEDMDVAVLDDDRTVELSFRRGDEEKAFTFKWPTMIYRGVWQEGVTYHPGDVVTWGGSAHVAERETADKPDTKDGGFRLAVKRGRDGKDYKPSEK